MAHDPRKLLFDIIEACKKVTEFTAGLSFEQFTSNALVKSAVHMQCIVIGEALMRLRESGEGRESHEPPAARVTLQFSSLGRSGEACWGLRGTIGFNWSTSGRQTRGSPRSRSTGCSKTVLDLKPSLTRH
jgi:hypothetical protein